MEKNNLQANQQSLSACAISIVIKHDNWPGTPSDKLATTFFYLQEPDELGKKITAKGSY